MSQVWRELASSPLLWGPVLVLAVSLSVVRSGGMRFIAQRLLHSWLLLAVFIAGIYLLLDAQPGDITLQLSQNPRIPPEASAILANTLGLDRPLWQRVPLYVFNFFQGDFGFSFVQYPAQVSTLITQRLPRTVMLFLSALLLAYAMGFGLGRVLAWRRGKVGETVLTVAGVGMYTVFFPWFAILMIWFFGYILNWFPIKGFIDEDQWSGAPFQSSVIFNRLLLSIFIATVVFLIVLAVSRRLPYERVVWGRRIGLVGVVAGLILYWWTSDARDYAVDILEHTMLPVITLASVTFAGVMLLTRSSMLETLREDYILTARAKGLPESVVRDHHASRNALLPVVTSFVLAISFVIAGGIITEAVFSWPGLGDQLLEATVREDIPLATASLGIIGALAMVGHLIADVLYAYLDPRIRFA